VRKPGEPIYLRGHLIALAIAVLLPIILLQIYKVYVGPVSFGVQLGFAVVISVFGGLALYFRYRFSARNQP
jgi:hypothetical protein